MSQGLKLNAMTQALAYQTIMERIWADKSTQRACTEIIVEHMKDCTKEIFGPCPTSEMFWKRICSKDFLRQAHFFLWITAHNVYMVENKWLRPSYNLEQQSWVECSHCNTLESMDHILTKCKTPGQCEIWKAAKTLWEKKLWGWRFAPVLGMVLAALLASFCDKKGKPGKLRCYRILMIKATHLIWKLRYEW